MEYEVKTNRPTNSELLGVDAALRRAAINAKKQADQQGTPFVTKSSTTTAGSSLSAPRQSNRKAKVDDASTAVFYSGTTEQI